MSELVRACLALPDFDTLQIVHFLLPEYGLMGVPHSRTPSTGLGWKQTLREQVKGVRDSAIDCLKRVKAGRLDGEGTTKTTLKVVELSPYRFYFAHDGCLYYLDYVNVKEFEG